MNMIKASHFAVAALLAAYFTGNVDSCTIICAGRKATVDGSVMVAHTDDAGFGTADVRLVRVPAMDHEENATRAVVNFNNGYPRIISNSRGPHYKAIPGHYDPNDANEYDDAKTGLETKPMGYIPQVRHTYAYFDQDYGMMNEKQLSIAESTCGARTVGWPLNVPYGYNLFGIAELTKIALERCDSARCAVQLMGDLAVKYGFFSEDSGDPNAPGYADSSEALAISDRYGEVWLFHVLTGANNASAVWVAQRVPDTDIAVIANGFVIRTFDLDDPDKYMGSDNIYDAAIEMGFWDPSKESKADFDFTKVYGYNLDYPLLPLYVGRRIWRVYDLLAPSRHFDSKLGYSATVVTYPMTLKPEILVDVKIMQSLLRDYYQGTEYDVSKGMAAGPGGMPVRFGGQSKVAGGWERPISMFRTMFSFVAVSRPVAKDSFINDGVAGTVWYGQASPHGTVYVPFSCGQKSLPESYLKGKQSVFDPESAWWAFSFANNWSYLRYNIISKDILTLQKDLQEKSFHNYKETMEKATKFSDSDKAVRYLETENNEFASIVVNSWWKMAYSLIGKYSDGYITTGEKDGQMTNMLYPDWFLKKSEYVKWPGETFQPPSGAVADSKPNPLKVASTAVTLRALRQNNQDSHRYAENNIEKKSSSQRMNPVIKFLCGTLAIVASAFVSLTVTRRAGYYSL